MIPRYNINPETILEVGGNCNRNFRCLVEECVQRVDDTVVCDNPETKDCIYRFGKSLPHPMCMCWVKIEIENKYY